MARHGLGGDQQARADILAQVDVLIRGQQRHGGIVAAADSNKAVHKVVPAFHQILAPFTQRAGKLAAVAVHRGVVAVVVRKAQVIDLVGELVELKNDAVVIDLRDARQRGAVIRQCAAGGNKAWVVHVGEARIGAF